MDNKENKIQRGEMYFVHLDPAFGREIGGYKTRPVVVISINDIHQGTRIVTVIPGTSTETKFPRENSIRIAPSPENRLREVTFFQCHQIRGIDQGRMTSAAIGRISKADIDRIEEGVRHSLGLFEEPDRPTHSQVPPPKTPDTH